MTINEDECMNKHCRILLFEEFKPQNHLVITGFPGFGYTGYIASRYIAQKLHLKRVGIIITRELPEYTMLEDYGIVFPFEIFTDKEKITVIINHSLPPKRYRDSYAKTVINWLRESNIRELILIGGLNIKLKEGDEKYRWLKGTQSKQKLDAPLMKKGLYIIGPLAHMIMYAEISLLPFIVILPYAEPLRLDPRAAAIAVEIIGKIYGITIDVSELYEDARKIEEELAEIIRQEEAFKRETSKKEEHIYM